MNLLRNCDKVRYSVSIRRSLYKKVPAWATFDSWSSLLQIFEQEMESALAATSKTDRTYAVMSGNNNLP